MMTQYILQNDTNTAAQPWSLLFWSITRYVYTRSSRCHSCGNTRGRQVRAACIEVSSSLVSRSRQGDIKRDYFLQTIRLAVNTLSRLTIILAI